jgi:hypothetical protein
MAMTPALIRVSLIIFSLSCGVPAKAQDSKTQPAPNTTTLTMVYAPAWSGPARSGVAISVNPGVYVLDSQLGKISFCETEVALVLAERSLCAARIGSLCRRISRVLLPLGAARDDDNR